MSLEVNFQVDFCQTLIMSDDLLMSSQKFDVLRDEAQNHAQHASMLRTCKIPEDEWTVFRVLVDFQTSGLQKVQSGTWHLNSIFCPAFGQGSFSPLISAPNRASLRPDHITTLAFSIPCSSKGRDACTSEVHR